MDQRILEQVGFSKGETEIYLVLLKIGESTASEIAKHTKIARPNVYDYLNKLKEKGLTGFVSKNHKMYYFPSSPERIIDYIDEKKDILLSNIDNLLDLYKPEKEASKIEVYEGSEGFKILMNDIIKNNKDFVGWGGSDKVREYVSEHIVERYLNLRKKMNIHGKMLYAETENVLETPLTKFKKIPKEFTSPSTIISYGNNVAIMIYTAIPVIIIVRSKELSKSYKKHFELLWEKKEYTILCPNCKSAYWDKPAK